VADFDIRRRSPNKNRASAASTSPSGELCAGGDGGTTLFRSVRSDEAGEHRRERSEQSNRIARAAVCTNERAARLRYSRQSALQLAASE